LRQHFPNDFVAKTGRPGVLAIATIRAAREWRGGTPRAPNTTVERNGLLDAAPSARTRSCRCRSCLLMALPVAVPQTPPFDRAARRTPPQPRGAQQDHRTPHAAPTARRSAGPRRGAQQDRGAALSRTAARRGAQQARGAPRSRTTARLAFLARSSNGSRALRELILSIQVPKKMIVQRSACSTST
jgi:hypothetical protein